MILLFSLFHYSISLLPFEYYDMMVLVFRSSLKLGRAIQLALANTFEQKMCVYTYSGHVFVYFIAKDKVLNTI